MADTPMTALGGALDGMLSEYAQRNGLVKVPANLSYEEAATLLRRRPRGTDS
jgi:NADPH:quinone reductase-like Zn-dependent oxidoreductase